MLKPPETALVPFHGHQLLTINDGNSIRVAMKPICEAIGLDWSAQFRRIERHPVLGTCVAMMATQLPGESQSREIVTLPLDYLNGWLFGIDTNRVKPEIRDLLIDYQRECFAALAAYWHQGIASNPRARATTIPQLLASHRHIQTLLKELKRQPLPVLRVVLHSQLEQACRLISIPCPALEAIGMNAAPDHESPHIDEFWEMFDVLLDKKDTRKLNHARADGLLAINLPQVQSATRAKGMLLPETLLLRRVLKHSKSPRFLGIKAVNSRHTKSTVKCWVFERNTTGDSL